MVIDGASEVPAFAAGIGVMMFCGLEVRYEMENWRLREHGSILGL